jgi:hypothetical protein
MATLYCTYVKEWDFEDPDAPHYYVITVRPTICGGQSVDISAITETAKSLSHCDILHIAAGFCDGILFDHDSICEFLELYAPNPECAIQLLERGREITIRSTFEQIHALG